MRLLYEYGIIPISNDDVRPVRKNRLTGKVQYLVKHEEISYWETVHSSRWDNFIGDSTIYNELSGE